VAEVLVLYSFKLDIRGADPWEHKDIYPNNLEICGYGKEMLTLVKNWSLHSISG